MLLKEQIKTETITAMRSKDKKRLGTIRLLSAAIKQKEVDSRQDIDDVAVLAIIDKMLSQRKESLHQYKEAKREDLAEQEEYEIGVLKEFLPAQLSEQEVDDLISNAIKSLSASTIRDMGKVVAELKPNVQGRADMAVVSKKVKDILS